MPKNLNYPLASFQKSFALADAVDALGGNASVETCAQKMQRKISGGFMVIISSAQKFSLVSFEKGIITTTEEYKLIKHSYTNSERLELLTKSFLKPQAFSVLYERFKGKELPVDLLDKILIREFGVEEATASRVAGYFLEGLKTYGLINANSFVEKAEAMEEKQSVPEQIVTENQPKQDLNIPVAHASFTDEKSEQFELQLSGPGINTKINLTDEEDLLIAEAILKKIRKSIVG